MFLKRFPPLYLVFQGSPVQDSREDVKPTSQELLNSLLSRDNGELVHTVKEEPGSPHSGLPTAGSPHSGGGGLNGHLENYSPPQLPPSPHSPVSPTLHRPQYLPPSGRSLIITILQHVQPLPRHLLPLLLLPNQLPSNAAAVRARAGVLAVPARPSARYENQCYHD